MDEFETLLDEMSYDKYGSTEIDEILKSDTFKKEFEKMIKLIEKNTKQKGRDLNDDFQM